VKGRLGQLLLIIGLGAAFLAMLSWVFDQRLRLGDVFPVYSSLRCDPLGIRALHDSLARLPGMRVERFYQPLERLSARPSRTIILAGLSQSRWKQTTAEEAAVLDAAVREGSRLVIVFSAELTLDDRAAMSKEDEPTKGEGHRKASERDSRKDRPPAEEGNLVDRPKPADWHGSWGVDVERQRPLAGLPDARLTEPTVTALPQSVPWQSELYFKTEQTHAWHTLYSWGSQPVLIERTLGRGTIVLATDSFFLSNEALQRARAPALLAWVIGPNRYVLFVESHLGVLDESGLSALIRRYGLGAAAGVAVLLASLFIWREMASFLPSPPPHTAEIAVSADSGAGLVVLLKRALSTQQLPEACVEEWRRAESMLRLGSKAPIARLEAAWRTRQSTSDTGPVAVYNALVRALRRRG
jgi:hypothetical protein